MVGAKVNPGARRRAEFAERQRHVVQRFDVGHAHQAEAHAFGAVGVHAVVGGVQCDRSVANEFGELRRPLIARSDQCERQQGAASKHRLVPEAGVASGSEGLVLGIERRAIRAVALRLMKLVDPCAADFGRSGVAFRTRATVALKVPAAIAIGIEQATHQGRRQGRRRQQYARTQQAGPMHEAGQRRQVVDVEIVRLVEHEVAAHQAQHRCDLAPAALAFGRGRQVVDGANEHRRGQQCAHLRVVHDPPQQRVGVVIAFEDDVTVPFVQKQRLPRRRAGAFGFAFVMLEQRPAGRAADADRQIVVAEIQQISKGAAGLQREGSQPHRKSAAHAALGVGQGVHDAGVCECLAAAGGGHVDDECTTPVRALAHSRCGLGGFVLPAKALVVRALAQAFVARQARQMFIEAGQRMRDFAAVLRDAEQVLVERLIQRAGGTVGVGMQRVAGRNFDAARVALTEARVVVVGQHQTKARDMHHVRVAEPITRPRFRSQLQEPLRHARGARAPVLGRHGQALREMPVRLDHLAIIRSGGFVPAGVDSAQHVLQQADLKGSGRAVTLARQNRQPVVRNDQPADGLGERCTLQGGERRGRNSVQAVALQTAKPDGVVVR